MAETPTHNPDRNQILAGVEELHRERAAHVARIAEIDGIFKILTLAGTAGGADVASTKTPEPTASPAPRSAPRPKGKKAVGLGARETGTPARVLAFLRENPEKVFRSPEIVAALEPSKEGDERLHFDMLVRTALGKFLHAEPPIVQRVGHGRYRLAANGDAQRDAHKEATSI